MRRQLGITYLSRHRYLNLQMSVPLSVCVGVKIPFQSRFTKLEFLFLWDDLDSMSNAQDRSFTRKSEQVVRQLQSTIPMYVEVFYYILLCMQVLPTPQPQNIARELEGLKQWMRKKFSIELQTVFIRKVAPRTALTMGAISILGQPK